MQRQELQCIPRCSPSEKGPSHFGLSGPYQMELGLEAFTVRRMLVTRFCRAPHACQPEAQIECDPMAARPTRALRNIPGRRWALCSGCRRCTIGSAARSYRQPFSVTRCLMVCLKGLNQPRTFAGSGARLGADRVPHRAGADHILALQLSGVAGEGGGHHGGSLLQAFGKSGESGWHTFHQICP